MAKRFLLVSALAAFVVGGAFAQIQMSAGAGFVKNGGRVGQATFDKYNMDYVYNLSDSNAGGFLFFDATYAELSVGFLGGRSTDVFYDNKTGGDPSKTAEPMSVNSITSLDISLLGRYPVAVGKMTVAPLLGVGYNIVVGLKDLQGNDPFEYQNKDESELGKKFHNKAGNYSAFRIQLGAGADFDVTDQVFLRFQGLAFYRLPTKGQDIELAYTASSKGAPEADWPKAKGGFGGTFTAAVGYRF